ncbi:hypothetical protein [Peribacillus simplex]|uniref:hypothetical protein n=1 Tax=Peribacillus simplex TaxID=1478 RepID=UPI0024C1C5FC|nr:hypothetical protein [Peribacillus simplex]WHY58626.1 hypothetical protein QNH43_10375 [Peribacillus simplex]
MKTTDKDNKLERVLDAMESADKKELLYAISELSSHDVEKMAQLVPLIRSAALVSPIVIEEKNMNGIFKPLYTGTYKSVLNSLMSNNKISIINEDFRDYVAVDLNEYENEQEPISDEENKEIEEKYGVRSKAPLKDFEEFKDANHYYDLLMKDKKDKGWKFLDEK